MSGLDVTLLRPLWLLALPGLALAAWWLLQRRGGLGDWQRAADPALLKALETIGWVDRRAHRGPLWTLLAMVALIILALSGPAVERRDALSFRNLDGVLLVLDASSSVTEDARWPQMLTIARFAVAALQTRPGGLIVYGGDAYLVSDMTLDHLQLGQTVSLITPDLVPDGGSRPERALAVAADRLEAADLLAGDVILFTDGDGLGPASLREAARIADLGARLSLVSMLTPSPDLATHAAAGQGEVFGLEDGEALADWLSAAARTRLVAQDFPLLFWTDLGRYMMALALLPMLLLFRRRRA